MLHALRITATAAFFLFAANIALLAVMGSYDVTLGPLHLKASALFKPLLYVNAAFLLAVAVRPAIGTPFTGSQAPHRTTLPALFAAAGIILLAAVYTVSFNINPQYFDWTHRSLTTGRHIWQFFAEPQYDGFYRPIAFTSLWLDNQLFGAKLWGYHIQNLLLHAVNGLLVARLSQRFGFSPLWACWAGLLFLALPAAFEAVIWPGARFDLLAATFTLIALERALAGSLITSTAAYSLGVLSKESAYCYPLILAALYLAHQRFALSVSRQRLLRIGIAAGVATLLLIALRFAVYGHFGGYPGGPAGQTVHFSITHRTFTSLFTRVPAALYLVNSSAGLTLWLRAALLLYAGALAAAVLGGARLGVRRAFLVLPFLAAVPALNVIAWLNHVAQQGRYVYQPGIWTVLAVCWALAYVRRGTLIAAALTLSMATAALSNTLAYVSMLRAADTAVTSATAHCRTASCCRTLLLQNVPSDLYGAFYFRQQVWRQAQQALPSVIVPEPNTAAPTDACTVTLRWTERQHWQPQPR